MFDAGLPKFENDDPVPLNTLDLKSKEFPVISSTVDSVELAPAISAPQMHQVLYHLLPELVRLSTDLLKQTILYQFLILVVVAPMLTVIL